MSLQCVILGGGGHAKVVIEALRAAGRFEPVAIVDADPSRFGETLLGIPIVGDDSKLPALRESGVAHAAVGIGGVRDNEPRRRVSEFASKCGFASLGVIHPSAVVSPSAKIADSAQILAGAIVGPDADVAEGAIVNNRAVVEHDCRVGAFAHIATGAVLSGGVEVGALAHIGAGAAVLQGVAIGEGAVVGAGAVVIRDVEPGQVVAGVPARPL